MEEKKFTLDGKEFIVKKFYFKPDRVKQIKFHRKYLNYEKEYIGEDLWNKFYSNMQRIKLMSEYVKSENSNVNNEELNKAIGDNLLKEDYNQEFNQYQSEAIQLFLFENEENAKTLCELHFENHNEIDHNPTDEKFLAYNNFILELFRYFFFGV